MQVMLNSSTRSTRKLVINDRDLSTHSLTTKVITSCSPSPDVGHSCVIEETLLLRRAVLPVQVSLDRQVGTSQWLHQPLTQPILLLQDVLQVAAEALQLLNAAS